MASVTQKVPTYVLGMSTQPDEKKIPGQVVDLVNGVPDVVRQLIKRPGSNLVKEITSDVDTGNHSKWFHIYTTDEEQYIGQCARDGDVKVWRCSDGATIPVDYQKVDGTNRSTYLDQTGVKTVKITNSGSGYTTPATGLALVFSGGGGSGAAGTFEVRGGEITNINITNFGTGYTSAPSVSFANASGGSNAAGTAELWGEKSSDIQVLTINETTFFCNRLRNTKILTDENDLSPAQVNEAFISLDTISYGKQYALDIYDPKDNTTYSYPRATGISAQEVIKLNGVQQKTQHGEDSDYSDNVTSSGHWVGNGDCEGMGRETVNVNTGTSVADTSPPNEAATGKHNLRYEMDIRCTPNPTPPVDTNYHYHDSYQAFPKLQFGGEGWETGDEHEWTSEKGVTTTVTVKSHVTVTSRANIAMVRPAPSSSTAEEHVSSGGLLGEIKKTLDAIPGTNITATICGNGIHLYSPTPFGVTTPEQQLMSITTTEANNIADLPRVCRHGYTVRIVNSGEDMDDYYLRFQAEGIEPDIIRTGTYTRAASSSVSGTYQRGFKKDVNILANGEIYTSKYWVNPTNDTVRINKHGWKTGQKVRYNRGGVSHVVPASAINVSTETITVTNHGFVSGQKVQYNSQGGTNIVVSGVTTTDDSEFYVIRVDDNNFKIANGYDTAIAGTARNITNAGNDSQTFADPDMLTNTNEYYVIYWNDNTIKLASSLANANAGVPLDIVSRGNEHQFFSYDENTITVTKADHYLNYGDQIVGTFTGAGTNGTYTIANVTDDTFTVTDAAAGYIAAGTSATYTHGLATITSIFHDLSTGQELILDFTSGDGSDGYRKMTKLGGNTITVSQPVPTAVTGTKTLTFQPARFGEGVWEEVCAPGITTTLDNNTMPLALTRVLPGTYSINGTSAANYTNGCFQFSYPDWGKRDVGDDVTNSEPSFIGHPIQRMIFFRNRIALLSGENIILSRVNDYYSFWVKTAMAISNADPIDLQSSSTYPTKLFDATEANAGLIIFSASEQFLLSSGAEALLTPETAKITYLSSYAFNSDTNPVSLGTTIGFLNSTARDARFYEMADASTREEPSLVEQTKIIGEKFPTDVTLVSGSTENDLLLFATDSTLHTATNEVWGYKWYTSAGKRAQSAWFRWTLPNKVVFQTILDDKYYVVLTDGSKYTLEKFDIKLDSDSYIIGVKPDENRVHLDTKKKILSADMTYHSGTDTTTFSLGAGYYSTKTLTAYCVTDSDDAGKSYDLKASDKTGSASNPTITLPGNWKTSTEAGPSATPVNSDLIIGYEYEFSVELPKLYVTRSEGEKVLSETRGSLVIHRMNFDFGDVGVIDVTLKRRGRDDYTYTVESLEWDNTLASTAAIAKGYLHTIPVYDRNDNLNVFIKSNHPSPATVHSMNWEGDYSPRYYQRV